MVAVVTKKGTRILADAVIVGAGVTPDVMLASRAGLTIGDRGGVLTDATLKSSADDVYAAGDIAEWDSPFHDGHVRMCRQRWEVSGACPVSGAEYRGELADARRATTG